MSAKKKKGRPFTSEEPLSHDLKVRISESNYNKLKKISSQKEITIAEVVRQSIIAMLNDK